MLDAILYINPFHYKLEHGMVFMKLQPCVTQLEIFQILVTYLNAKNGHLCFDSFPYGDSIQVIHLQDMRCRQINAANLLQAEQGIGAENDTCLLQPSTASRNVNSTVT